MTHQVKMKRINSSTSPRQSISALANNNGQTFMVLNSGSDERNQVKSSEQFKR